MKRLLPFIFVFTWMFPVFPQHNRRVLVEEFTNASADCISCPFQESGFNATLQANYDFVTAIKYHVGWSNLGFDPLNAQNPSEVDARENYYTVVGIPYGMINGTAITDDCNAYEGSPACLNDTDLANAYAKLTPVSMSISHSLSSNYDSIYVQVSVTSDDKLIGPFRLYAAITEEEILFDTPPTTSGETEFFQVMRKMLPNASGTATGDFAAGETKTYSFVWKIGYAYDLNEIGAIAWLQNDDTKEVWQSERSLPVGDIPAAGVSVLSHNAFACFPGYEPAFTIKNTGSNALTDVNLRWRVGDGVWKDYTWTGDLAPGTSSQITLDTAFSATGTYEVAVQVLNSNNGTQTNLINAISAFQVRALFNIPSTLPFSHGFQTGAVPPSGWTVNNFVFGPETTGWELATNAGAGSSRSACCHFYDFPLVGNAILTTPKIDLSQANGVTTLSFDHAYVYFDDNNFDSLRIEVSNDCGTSWKTIFHNGKDGLATFTLFYGPAWVPTADDWANNSIDISEFNGSPEVLIRFIGECGRGNNLYLDNINVSSIVGVKELAFNTFSIWPNPANDWLTVDCSEATAQPVEVQIFDASGKLCFEKGFSNMTKVEEVPLEGLAAGAYQVRVRLERGFMTRMLLKI